MLDNVAIKLVPPNLVYCVNCLLILGKQPSFHRFRRPDMRAPFAVDRGAPRQALPKVPVGNDRMRRDP